MDNYMMMNDMVQNHQERMMNLKKYYPFFKLMDTGFGQYQDGRYAHLDMAYLVMAVLRFLIEYNHFQDQPVDYEQYDLFMRRLLKRDFPDIPDAGDDGNLIQYIFDKICNDGRPFVYNYYDPSQHQMKTAHVRLVDTELAGRQVCYRISSEAVAFYLETKEVQDESSINVAQLLLAKLIKARDFRGGLEVIGRINMDVGRLLKEKDEIQTLLNRHVQEGLKALEDYHERLLLWFDEEQKMFRSNMELSAKAIARVEADHADPDTMKELYALDTALKNATRKHAQLMHAYVEMQKAGDEALDRAKRTRFRSSVDFMDVQHRLIETDRADALAAFVMPLFAPKRIKTFSLTKVDELLLYKPEEVQEGEKIVEDVEQQYVYEDELVDERIGVNFEYLFRVLLDQIRAKNTVTLEYMNYLYGIKYSENIYTNGDYYAFLVHLCQKDHYDMDAIRENQDTFLESMIASFLEKHTGEYTGLKFRLVFLPEETVTIADQREVSNIRFEREDG